MHHTFQLTPFTVHTKVHISKMHSKIRLKMIQYSSQITILHILIIFNFNSIKLLGKLLFSNQRLHIILVCKSYDANWKLQIICHNFEWVIFYILILFQSETDFFIINNKKHAHNILFSIYYFSDTKQNLSIK